LTVRRTIAVLAVVTVAVVLSAAVDATADSGGLQGNVDPAVDATQPTVTVAASSAPVNGAVALLVRNGTTKPVKNLRVAGTLVTADGGSAVKVNATPIVPSVLAPGALALTRVDFDPHALTAGTKMSFHVRSKSTKTATDPGALMVQDVQLGAPQVGPVAQTLTATVTNPSRKTVKGPVAVMVVCFGEARDPAFAATTSVKHATLRTGATMPVTVNLSELCPSYLVGAKGATTS